MRGITILVFAYNEELLIKKTLNRINRVVQKINIPYEIIVLNDGSTDNTAKVIKKNFAKMKYLKLINLKKNLGLSGSFQRGLKISKFNKITWFPGDDSYLSKNLIKFLKQSQNYDIVVGYRNNMHILSIKRRILSNINKIFINILTKKKLLDIHGILTLTKKDLSKINFFSDRYTFLVEIVPKIVDKKTSILNIPVFLNNVSIKNSNTLSTHTIFIFVKTWLIMLFWRIFNG